MEPINYTPPIYLRDNKKRAKDLIIAFWILIGLTLIAMVSGYLELELLEKANSGGYYTNQEAESNDLRQGIVGVSQSIMIIILALLFIRWLRRAYVNAGLLSVGKLEKDDVWVVWGFILPIISWWYPYSITAETNSKMDRFLTTKNHVPETISWIIGVWWASYLIREIIGKILFKLVFKDDTLEQLIASTQATIFSDFFDIIAALITMMLILKMAEKEKKIQEIVAKLNHQNGTNVQSILEEE